MTFDKGAGLDLDTPPNIVEISVSAAELARCQETLRELRQRPVVTDDGWKLPFFAVDDDLPKSVCVITA